MLGSSVIPHLFHASRLVCVAFLVSPAIYLVLHNTANQAGSAN